MAYRHGPTPTRLMIIAWLGALLVGLSLGLMGSGGSILTVPALIYLVGQGEKVAIAGSLAIVALIESSGQLESDRLAAVQLAIEKSQAWLLEHGKRLRRAVPLKGNVRHHLKPQATQINK